MTEISARLPAACVGLKLYRIDSKDTLIANEGVLFTRGRPAVIATLLRAAIAGRVEVGGKVENHFADCLEGDGSWSETVALDANSYKALKYKWMRCRVEVVA